MSFVEDINNPPFILLADWDETFVTNTYEACAVALNRVAEAMALDGQEPEAWTAEEAIARLHESIPSFMGNTYSGRSGEALDLWVETYKQNLDEVKLMDGAQAVLDLVRKNNIPIAIVSNKDPGLARAEINQLGIEDYFRMVVGVDFKAPEFSEKPAPDMLEHVLKEIGVAPTVPVIYLGDGPLDYLAARNVTSHRCCPVVIGKSSHKKIVAEMEEGHSRVFEGMDLDSTRIPDIKRDDFGYVPNHDALAKVIENILDIGRSKE